jgi:radical SAM superfamily enzyme YgiQ (UPF0313 family)
MAESLLNLQDAGLDRAGRTMRAMLIFPPATHAVRAMYTFQENARTGIGVKPPLGPMLVASYLKQHSPHEVRILDCQVLGLDEEQIEAEIRDYRPDVVGVSAWTDFWYDAWRCIQIAKRVDPDIHVTVGGPHVGVHPDVTLAHSGCDSVVVGDGEVPFSWLLNALSNGARPAHVPGLHFREHGVEKGAREFYVQRDLDALPFPDRQMLPYRLYHSVVAKNDVVTTMITSRGCPYRCTFCKLSFQKTLSRSADNVLGEMERIAELNIREIEIYDDTFTWSKKRLIDICRGMIERGFRFDWAIRDRVSNATSETMEWLARAGCRRIHFGIESGSNKTLKTIKKAIDVDQAIQAVSLARQHGIQVLAYFMLGLPGETIEDMRETIRFARRLDPDYATFSVTVPYPGTEMYQEALGRGIIPCDYWLEFTRQPSPDFAVPFFWEEHLNKDQLRRVRDEATRSFYFRPRYVFRQLRQCSSAGEFRRKGSMALGLFRATVLARGRRKARRGMPGRTAALADGLADPRSSRK